jgi:SPP1 gp7 family putative phage head morphogenesis protein
MATIDPSFDLLYAMTLPPAAAVDYFKQKGLKVSDNWYDLLGEIQNKVFTVANLSKLDVLQDIKDELDKAMNGNVGFAEFKKNLVPTLQAKGWWGKAIDAETGEITKTYPGTTRPVQYGSPYRLKLIYDVNLQTSFMAGRRSRQLENVDERPYWMYVAVMDSRTRPSHRALHGRVFRYDDPFWQHFYPPNGYRCRCRVRTLSAAEVGMGDDQTPLSKSVGRLDQVEVPLSKNNPDAGTTKVWRYMWALGKYVQTDVGWDHAPGTGWEPNLNRYDASLVEQYRKEVHQ